MSFENKTTDELLRIVNAGLGFTLNTKNISAGDIYQISKAAAGSGAIITMINESFFGIAEPA